MTSIVLAIKCHEDHYYDNNFYSKVGGISCKELNLLESDMLIRIDYDLHVPTEIYEQYKDRVLEQVSQ